MKLVAALLITLSCVSVICAQTPASTCEPREMSDLARDKLKGPIKTIKIFKTVFFVSEKTGRLEKRPRELENETEYEGNGERDGGGITFHIPGDMEFNGVRYVCGDHGKLKELRFVANDGSTFPRKTYLYDEKGRTTEETSYFQNGSIEGKTTHVYDAAGNMIEEVNTIQVHPEHFRPMRYDVYVTTKATYKYDVRGNQIEKKHFYPDGSLATTWFFAYDARDRLIKKTRIDKLGRLEDQSFYEYHPDGRLLTETLFHNFCYTKENDFCKGYISSGDGFFYYATRTRHRYDSQGNWIKQTEWHMNGTVKKPVWEFSEIIEREITYYRN